MTKVYKIHKAPLWARRGKVETAVLTCLENGMSLEEIGVMLEDEFGLDNGYDVAWEIAYTYNRLPEEDK